MHTNTMKWLIVMVIFLWFSSIEATRMGVTSQSFVVLNEVVADGRGTLSSPIPNPNPHWKRKPSIPPPPDLS